MVNHTLAGDLALALQAASNADLVSLSRFQAQDLQITTKPDRTPVTDADKATEDIIRSTIAASRPDDSIFGEEGGSDGNTDGSHVGRQWIIDPIDGTAGFLRGLPVWATLISLVIDGNPVVGVVSAPALKKRWWAATGLGAWTSQDGRYEHERLGASTVHALQDATLSYNSLQGWMQDGRLNQLTALASAVWRTRAIGDFWSYMLVAEGLLDVAGEPDLQPYDIAALVPIVREAGGRFTSLDGHEDMWHGTALASNTFVHDEALAIIKGAS